MNYEFSTEHQSLGGKAQKLIPRECTAVGLWQCLAVLCLFSAAQERMWQSISTPFTVPDMLGKGTKCRLTAHGYWADQTTPLQFLFGQICYIPTISGSLSICPSTGKFFLSCKNHRKAHQFTLHSHKTLYLVESSLFVGLTHFEMAVYPELAVLLSFWSPSL